MVSEALNRTYWLDLFTGTTWEEFLRSGGTVSGFSEKRWTTLQKMKPGDYLLCYMTGISRWIGILEVTGKPYRDTTPIWKDAEFPSRVPVKILVALKPETGVPIFELRDKLSIFANLDNPNRWTGYFRGSPAPWKRPDAEVVCESVREAQNNPVLRPFDAAKLMRRAATVEAAKREEPEVAQETSSITVSGSQLGDEATDHTEVQWMLLKIGNEMGLDVWVGRNDKGRSYNGNTFASLPRMLKELPVQFEKIAQRIIENIDVLWLSGKSIVAAFEIESTTSIYSGLLRMSDLVARQPNLKIPLFVVAPDDKAEKVVREVNRPTFSILQPPLNEICRVITFADLRERVTQVMPFIKHVKPDFIEEIADSCVLPEL
jgi:hypothetical protein